MNRNLAETYLNHGESRLDAALRTALCCFAPADTTVEAVLLAFIEASPTAALRFLREFPGIAQELDAQDATKRASDDYGKYADDPIDDSENPHWADYTPMDTRYSKLDRIIDHMRDPDSAQLGAIRFIREAFNLDLTNARDLMRYFAYGWVTAKGDSFVACKYAPCWYLEGGTAPDDFVVAPAWSAALKTMDSRMDQRIKSGLPPVAGCG